MELLRHVEQVLGAPAAIFCQRDSCRDGDRRAEALALSIATASASAAVKPSLRLPFAGHCLADLGGD